jgi:hypothetical protein
MLRHMRVLLSLILVFTPVAIAGNKKKHMLPAYVINARTVVVLIDPRAGTSTTSPLANRTAQQDVEKALMKWGRLTPVMETQTADLVIVIRKGSGKVAQATIGGLPTNDRPVVGESTDGSTRVGVQQGRPPGGLPSGAQDTTPHPQAEVGAADDMFVVYQGHVDRPLERPSIIWRYSAQDALESPAVPAVDKFRKVIEESEKQQQAKP